MAVYYKSHIKHINTLSEQNAVFTVIKPAGAYSNH
jgi:hypothetical protein